MADQPIIWALLVGIANYPVDPIPGCIRDIENVYVNELAYKRESSLTKAG